MAQVCEEHYDCSECSRYAEQQVAELTAEWEKATKDAQAIADVAIAELDRVRQQLAEAGRDKARTVEWYIKHRFSLGAEAPGSGCSCGWFDESADTYTKAVSTWESHVRERCGRE